MSTLGGKSQNKINFAYDSAGNRVSRTISLGSTKSAIGGGGIAEFEEEKNFFTESLAEKQIKIYPNPTRGQLRVEILGYEDLEANSFIQVFTSNGALIYKAGNLSQTNDINLTDKPAGLYIMLINIAGERSSWKIIKK
jgi:hypothetical protein